MSFFSTRLLAASALALAVATPLSAKTFVYCSEGSPEGFDPAPYTAGTTQHPPTQDPGPHPAPEAEGTEGALPQTELMKRRLEARISELGLQGYRDRLKTWTARRWGIASLADLSAGQNRDLYDRLEDFAERIALEQEGAADIHAAANG